jgi:FkbM family methyltransferase
MTARPTRRWWNQPRFDVIEITLLAGFAVILLLGWVATRQRGSVRPAPDEWTLAQLAERYGPARFSRNAEEWIIRDFFQDRRAGVFLDVGANHYRHESNTYYLEHELGWTGIAVEPLVEFEADYRQHRPGTRFRAFFASDASNQRARMFYLGDNPLVTSSTKEFTAREGGGTPSEIEAPTITLDDLLANEKVDRLDFLSMDIELAEPKALSGFDLRRFAPSLVCIEAHREVRQWLLNYFHDRGYVAIGKYMGVDLLNLYFAPRADADRLAATK